MDSSMVISLFFAVLIWTLAATAVLLFQKHSTHSGALLKYHLCSLTLVALPAGLFGVWYLDFSWILPTTQLSAVAITILEPTIFAETSTGGGLTEQASAGGSFSLLHAFIVLLGISAMAGFLRLLFVFIRLKRTLRETTPITDKDVLKELVQIKQKLGIRRKVELLSAGKTGIPFTTGFFKTRIVLPLEVLHHKQNLSLVLTHECIHIKRMDYHFHLAELAVRHLFWVHPLVHVLYKKASEWREISCDDGVLKTGISNPADYMKMLYDFAIYTNEKPLFKAAMADKSTLLKRIESCSQTTKQKETTMKKSLILSTLAMLAVGLAMACTDMAKNPDATEMPETIIFNGEEMSTVTVTAYLERNMNDVQAEIDRLNQENVKSEHLRPMQSHYEMLSNIKRTIEGGHIARFMDEDGNLLIPPPPPTPPTQPTKGAESDADTFTVVEQMPELIGGLTSLYEVLEYPQVARRAGIEGTVLVGFIVDEQGRVQNPHIARSAGAGLDEAALNAVKQVEFTPGVQRGQNVRTQMLLPVSFRLQ